MLCSQLKEMGKTVWLDVHMKKRDMAAMKEGVQHCKCFLAIVTDNGKDSYFSRDMCREEITWAKSFEKKIVPVCTQADKRRIGTELIPAGQKYNIDFSELNFVVRLIYVIRPIPSFRPHMLACPFLMSRVHRTSTVRRHRG